MGSRYLHKRAASESMIHRALILSLKEKNLIEGLKIIDNTANNKGPNQILINHNLPLP